MIADEYHILGDDHLHGRSGRKKDAELAFYNWSRGAELGHPQCIKNMVWAYRSGIGVEPDRAKAYFWEAKMTPIYMSDPQIHQDKWVESVFAAKRNGFFLEIGASDGVGGSNTFMLEQFYEWSGICIEPNPDFYAKLVENRAAKCVNACIAPDIREVEFRTAGYYGGIQDNLSEWHKDNWKDAQTIKMTTKRIDDVLAELECPPVIDYLSLDIEGGEAAIIESFPFDRYKVRTMTVERSEPHLAEVIQAAGFRIVPNKFQWSSVDWELHCIHEAAFD